MKYEKGLVSVIIPTYRRTELLLKSIQAVLNQTYKKIELIIVNDNIIGDEYSQKLYKIIDQIKDDRLHFIEQEKHINGAAARNVGIKYAKGEFIAFQDDDDYWELNKIELQLRKLSSLDKTWGAVACLQRFYKNNRLVEVSIPHRSGFVFEEILDGRISIGTGAILIRREALDDSGYWDERLNRHQDLQLFARLSSKYKIYLDKIYLHNREIKDGQNRPTTEKLLEIKKAYFNSISDLIEKQSLSQQKVFFNVHNFELAYSYLRENNYKMALKYSLLIISSPKAMFISIKRAFTRIIGKNFKWLYIQLYSK